MVFNSALCLIAIKMHTKFGVDWTKDYGLDKLLPKVKWNGSLLIDIWSLITILTFL